MRPRSPRASEDINPRRDDVVVLPHAGHPHAIADLHHGQPNAAPALIHRRVPHLDTLTSVATT